MTNVLIEYDGPPSTTLNVPVWNGPGLGRARNSLHGVKVREPSPGSFNHDPLPLIESAMDSLMFALRELQTPEIAHRFGQ